VGFAKFRRAALSQRNTPQREGRVPDEQLATDCRIRDGRISSIDMYLSDVEMAKSFCVRDFD